MIELHKIAILFQSLVFLPMMVLHKNIRHWGLPNASLPFISIQVGCFIKMHL